MKAMFTECCGDIIAPERFNYEPRWCHCERHAVWWRVSTMGLLSIYDKKQENNSAYVLGFNNDWLMHPKEKLSKLDYRAVIESCPASYIFKTVESVCIRIRPGESNDTQWEKALP